MNTKSLLQRGAFIKTSSYSEKFFKRIVSSFDVAYTCCGSLYLRLIQTEQRAVSSGTPWRDWIRLCGYILQLRAARGAALGACRQVSADKT